MAWKNIIKDERFSGDEGDIVGGKHVDVPSNPPKGKERLKMVKDIFKEVDDANDILHAASSWSSPETYERITNKLSELVKEIKGLEKEAIEYHSN